MLSRYAKSVHGLRSSRWAPTVAAGLVAVAGSAAPAKAQDWHWNAEDGDWSTASKWLPLALPTPAANVFMGSTLTAKDAIVDLDMNPTIANLVITDGIKLFTRIHTLSVAGNTVVSGSNYIASEGALSRSMLVLGAKDGVSLLTHNLTVSDDAQVYLGGGIGIVGGQLRIDDGTEVAGNGILQFSGAGTTLVNNGHLDPGVEGGLILQQTGGGRFDLDGTTGEGVVHLFGFGQISDQGTALRLDGVGLSDSFSGELTLGPDSDLFMNLTEGWVADANSEIRMTGFQDEPALPAVIRGSGFDFAGHLLVNGPFGGQDAGRLEMRSSEITLRAQTRVELAQNARLTIGGEPTSSVLVEGGTYDIAEGGIVRFEAPTELRGGVFSTASDQATDGAVELAGGTTYNGEVTFNGFARQIGDAEVSGWTTINADRFYMSVSAQTGWTISNPLTVNADYIGTSASVFRGEMRIGGALGVFTANLGGGQWTMTGDLSLPGQPGFFVTRIAGADLNLEGSLTVPTGRSQITADTFFREGSSVAIPLGSHLRMASYSAIDAGVLFTGEGMLHNGIDGTMVLHDGASLERVGLTNQGSLHLGLEEGVASVDRFTNTADGTLYVTIIGYESGIRHDKLLVTGGSATLGGELFVSLFQVGMDGVLPQVGDEFTIVAALGGVTGMFLNDPVSVVGSLTYDWTVIYNPNTVVLRVETITPAPAGLSLLSLAGLAATRRRRPLTVNAKTV